ncbi:MAG TPA: DUF885 domain-containing protein [Acidimicrobiales bacterium]|nr:DUF885 domain-containing protein [Acidimicrobiales bacterium]
MTSVAAVADEYVERSAALDPASATQAGIVGHDHELTDYSPAGIDARVQLARETLRALESASLEGDRERVARELLRERLSVQIDQSEAGEDLRALRPMASPLEAVRVAFDLMPTATDDDWATIEARMAQVPAALAGFTESLRLGLARGLPAARRQALACAEQARAWADGYFSSLVARRRPRAGAALLAAADRAAAAFARMASFLEAEYVPFASEQDGVGRDRYALAARESLGADVDLAETYAWGVEELARLEREMAEAAGEVLPGAPVAGVFDHLETEPSLGIEGEERFRDWLQSLMDATVTALDGTAFEIPPPIRRVEAMIAPPGGAAAMYYTPPSEDLERPGRTWYPTLGRTWFPLWGEVTTAYHEGVPGHHLQAGTLRVEPSLTRYQRNTFVSGHGEGWALYAERLMDELGYFEQPHFRLGYLRAQAFRAMRVVVDIGAHTGERPPPGAGDAWTYETVLAFALAHGWEPEAFLRSEVDRYLGWPGQAISYKVGERVWLECRDAARRQAGFDLAGWHRRALALGPLGLDLMRHELA